MNPYLALAAMLAAGLKGIEDKLDLPEPFRGDAYADDADNHIPRTLRDARETLLQSTMLRAAMGDDVIDHYARAAEVELEDFNRVVTDYEIARGFEKA
jgi:glutamine synthetase